MLCLQTPSKRPPLESKEHPTPSKLPVTDRRRVMVSITPMKMSPLKSMSKTRHVSPVLTQQGIRKLRATNARLKRVIASRRLKMEGKDKDTVSPHTPEEKDSESTSVQAEEAMGSKA